MAGTEIRDRVDWGFTVHRNERSRFIEMNEDVTDAKVTMRSSNP
ncbi:hypothetical protein [Leptolyngbya iicbica]|nr:hypothetical protein [Leptolyngbya sp. LK]